MAKCPYDYETLQRIESHSSDISPQDPKLGWRLSNGPAINICDVTDCIFPDEMVKVISDQMGDQMEQAKAVIDQLDVDKDGKVSYPEFILVMKYKK